MADSPPAGGVNVLVAVRRRPWLVAATPVATVALALAFVLWVRPLFESTTTLRFEEEESPFSGVAASALGGGGGGGGGLSLLAGLTGRGVPIQTEMSVLSSRALARGLAEELGLRMELRRPRRVARRRLFEEVSISEEAPEGEYVIEAAGDGTLRLRGEVLVERDPFRPFLNERTEVRELGAARPGEPLPIEGARVVPGAGAAGAGRVVFRILGVDEALERLQERVVVSRPERDADVVEVAVRWTDPELAARMADVLVRRFLEWREEAQAERFGRTAGFLASQMDSLRRELGDAEEALRRYRESEGVVEPEAQATAAVEQLAELQGRRDLLSAERRALLRLVNDIDREVGARTAGAGEPGQAPPDGATVAGTASVPAAVASGPDAADPAPESPYRRLVFFPTLLRNTATAELLRLLGELENERAELYARRTAAARDVRVLADRIGGLETQLRTVAETYLEGLGNQVASLDEAVRGFQGELSRVPAVELEYLRRRRQVEVLSQLYTFMEVRQKEAEVTAAGEAGGVRVVDRPTAPVEPVRPLPALTLGLGLVVGLIVGVAGAVVLEHARPAGSPA